ncbi:MAG: hypothetical protein H0Z33_06995 [Bacillaceae bacterium]|nr:hypothetical protein [Bacillaceae bacterium]
MITSIISWIILIMTYAMGKKLFKEKRHARIWFVVFSIISMVLSVLYAFDKNLVMVTSRIESIFAPIARMVIQ